MSWLRIFIDLVAIRSDFCPCANWSRLVTKTGAIAPIFVTTAPFLVAICQINPAFLIILARQGRGELRSIILILLIAHGSSIRSALFALNN